MATSIAVDTATDSWASDVKSAASQLSSVSLPLAANSLPRNLSKLYEGGRNSLVARAVGAAEGTRTSWGGYTKAYYGHTDPGNGVWNLGTFSYQHGAKSPEEADFTQLKTLRKYADFIVDGLKKLGITPTLKEVLNGIDLGNQAPLALLDRGYIPWLKKAYDAGMSERDRIIYARTRSYLDPDTGYWNAPGLGNTLSSIQWDQTRRYGAINDALYDWNKKRGLVT